MRQMPPTQVWPAPQVTPQPPQLAGSLAVVTHWPLQLDWPAGHWHVPPWQVFPLLQTTPQPPQLLLSEPVVTQALPQTC
jgi:hypothetical protein